MECPVISFEMGLFVRFYYGSLYVDIQGYVPALLENLCGMSCSEIYWLLDGCWFQCRYGGYWMVSYYLMFCVFSSFLVFWGFGLKSLASQFQFYSSSSLKTSPIYSTDNKTSRLMVKRFSTMRDTREVHRVTWKRGEGGGRYRWAGGEKGGLKRRETDLHSFLFPKCSPYSRYPQRFTELDWEKKGKGENRGVLM